MPYGLVNTQANEDVVRGFQLGFAHASSLIQRQQEAAALAQREQLVQQAENERQQNTIKNMWAIAAMKLGVAADNFKRASNQKRIDLINKNYRADGISMITDRIKTRNEFLQKNGKNISNSADYENANAIDGQKKLALDSLQPEEDGVLDPNKINTIAGADPSYQNLAPSWTPEYQKAQNQASQLKDLQLENTQMSILNKRSAIAKRNRSGSGRGSSGYSAKDILRAHNSFQVGLQKYYTQVNGYNSDLKQNGVADPTNMNKANAWSASAMPFFSALQDPQYVGNVGAAIVQRGMQQYGGFSTPRQFNDWLTQINTMGNNVSPEQSGAFNSNVLPAIKSINNFINGYNMPDNTDNSGTDGEDDGE